MRESFRPRQLAVMQPRIAPEDFVRMVGGECIRPVVNDRLNLFANPAINIRARLIAHRNAKMRIAHLTLKVGSRDIFFVQSLLDEDDRALFRIVQTAWNDFGGPDGGGATDRL